MRWSWESFASGLLVGAAVAGLLWLVIGETERADTLTHVRRPDAASAPPVVDTPPPTPEAPTALSRGESRPRVDPASLGAGDGIDTPPPIESDNSVVSVGGRVILGGDGGSFRVSFKGGENGWIQLIGLGSHRDPAPALLRWSKQAARDRFPGDELPTRRDIAARLVARSYAERAVGLGLATRAQPPPIDLLVDAARDTAYPDLRGASLLAAFEAAPDDDDVRAAILDLALDGDVGTRRTAIGLLGQIGSEGGARAAAILLSGDYTAELLDQLCGAVAQEGDVATFLAASPQPDAAASVMRQLASRLAVPGSDADRRLLEALPQLVRPLLESPDADQHAPLLLPQLAARGHGAFLRGVAATSMYRDAVRIAAVTAAIGQEPTRPDGIAAAAAILTDPSTSVALARGVMAAVGGSWVDDPTLRSAVDAAARSHPSAWVRDDARRHLAEHDPASRGTIVIHEAAYGAGDGWVDVTDQLRAAIREGRLEVQAGNELGGDPKVGAGKSLRVEFSLDGERRLRTVGEGAWLKIP